MKLKKCSKCGKYTFKENCDICQSETKDAHYKFIKIRDAPKSQDKFRKTKNETGIGK